jgi:hypothetical protein
MAHVPNLAAAMPAMPAAAGSKRACGVALQSGDTHAARAVGMDPLQRFEQTYAQLEQDGIEAIAGYVLFHGHTDALALFQAAKTVGYSVRISPTPRDARSSCGVALLVPCESAAEVYGLACAEGIAVESMVALPKQINAHRDRYC